MGHGGASGVFMPRIVIDSPPLTSTICPRKPQKATIDGMQPIERPLADMRDLPVALREHAAAMDRTTATAKELVPVIGQEVRDTSSVVIGKAVEGGGTLIVVWFVVKLVLIWWAAKNAGK